METLPKALAEEIESLEELDARALKRKYPALLSDMVVQKLIAVYFTILASVGR